MRKEELIKQVAESTGIAICEIRTVIEAALKETVDAENNLILVKGAVPGPKKSTVIIKESVKA